MKLTKGVQKWEQRVDIVEVQVTVRAVFIAARANMSIVMMRSTASGAVRQVMDRVVFTVRRANIATGLDRTSASGAVRRRTARDVRTPRRAATRSDGLGQVLFGKMQLKPSPSLPWSSPLSRPPTPNAARFPKR